MQFRSLFQSCRLFSRSVLIKSDIVMPPKKPKCLTLKEKMFVLQEIDKGARVTDVAHKYGIAKATVCSIKNKKSMILNIANNTLTGPGKRKTLKKPEQPNMELRLYNWFLRQRLRHVPVSGDMLKEKAKQLHLEIKENNSDFNASDGWLHRFKKRFGIRLIKISGEKLSAEVELVQPFQRKLQQTIEEMGLSKEQIYNADETALFWKLLPEKTFVTCSEKTAPGRKTVKQRVTLLLCANATGQHKLTPLIIGKAKNPRSFRNFNCPVHYKNTKNAWMTANIFRDWFHTCFVPEVTRHLTQRGLPVKALLLIDNAPSHPPEELLKSKDGKVLVMFMPPNVTSIIQPMDQNAIRLTKLYYRKSLLASIVAENGDIGEILKKITLKDAIQNVTIAWSRLQPNPIAQCWKPLLNKIFKEEDISDDDVPLAILRERWIAEKAETDRCTLEVAQMLRDLNTGENFNPDDIFMWNNCDNAIMYDEPIDDAEDDDDDPVICINETQQKISANEAVAVLNRAIKWAEDDLADTSDIIALRRLRERAITKYIEGKQKQTKITSYLFKT